MELYRLQSFVAVAKVQNLTRAARDLHLSQSALSSQLKALEDELGVPLFNRTPRGMALTDQGRVLLTHAVEVLEAVDGLLAKAATLRGGRRSTVTIGLNADPTFLRVSTLNRVLAERAPALDVIFVTSQTVRTVEMLRQGVIDLGFMYGLPADADIRRQVLSEVPIAVAVPTNLTGPRAPQSWEEVAALPWIWVGADSPFYQEMAQRMEARGLSPVKAVTTVDEQIVRELLLAGQGVAMIRWDEARPLLEAGRIRLWEEGGLTLPLVLAWREGGRQGDGVARAVEAVRAVWEKTP